MIFRKTLDHLIKVATLLEVFWRVWVGESIWTTLISMKRSAGPTGANTKNGALHYRAPLWTASQGWHIPVMLSWQSISAWLGICANNHWLVVCGGGLHQHVQTFTGLPQPGVDAHPLLLYDKDNRRVKATPPACRLEILRFLGLMPLARLNFRLDMHPMCTYSDASSQGGGICASACLGSRRM